MEQWDELPGKGRIVLPNLSIEKIYSIPADRPTAKQSRLGNKVEDARGSFISAYINILPREVATNLPIHSCKARAGFVSKPELSLISFGGGNIKNKHFAQLEKVE